MESEDSVTFYQEDLLGNSFAGFRDMRNNGELCDLTITIQHLSFAVHRVVLAAGIPYFRSLFASSAAETGEKEISAANLEPTALESVINLAYSGKMKITTENVHSLLVASQFLELEHVSEACLQFLSKRINARNVIQVRKLAESLNNSNLIESLNRYVRKNFEEFSKSQSFLRLPASWIKEIISDDELNVSSEEVVVEAILDWVRTSPSERRGMLPELLHEVRMIYLPTNYLMGLAASERFIRSSIPCRDLIDAAKNYHLSKDESTFANLKKVPRKYSGVTYDLYAICRSDAQEICAYNCNFVHEMWQYISESQISSDDTLYHVTAVDKKIYVFLDKTIHEFHTDMHTWEVLEPTHEKIEGAAVALHGSNIYFFGSVMMDFRNKVRCYNIQQNKWLKEVRMKVGVDHCAAATVQRSIYVTGGFRMSHNSVKTVDKYNPSTGNLSESAPMLSPRASHGCATMNEKLYVCGGFNVSGLTRTTEVYDPITNQWTSLSKMRLSRSYFSLVPYYNKILAIGGKMGGFSLPAGVESYDPDCDHWTIAFPVPEGFHFAASVSSAVCKRNSKSINC